MGEAAPQAAELDETIKSAVAALRHGWGEAYRIGRDPLRDWCELLTAACL